MPSEISRAADRLLRAEGAGVPCDGIGDLIDRTSPSQGHAVQAAANAVRIRSGRSAIGHKIGLTSAAAQEMFGATEPMRGMLFADSLLPAGAHVALAQFCAPRLEGEIVLKVARRPDPAMDEPALAATLASAHAAFEIADSRVRDWRIGIGEAIADNACCARFGYVEPGLPLNGLALPQLAMTIRQDGVEAPLSTGSGANCLGSPLRAYRWLVGVLAGAGLALEPGDLILTGALGPVVAMEPGLRYLIRIEGLGTLRLTT